jgi:hypothetical protein
MAGRGMRRLRAASALIGLVLGLGLVSPAAAAACDAAPAPFQRVVDRAERIFLVTVAQRQMGSGGPERYSLVVREALRGTLPDDVDLPSVVSIAAPVINACGDVLDYGITTHLILALDVPAFDGAEPIAVPWRLMPDGTLLGGHDDGPERWADLEAFRNALAGRSFATPGPTPVPAVAIVPDGNPIASVGIVVALLVGILAGVIVVVTGRRAARPRQPRPPSPG